MKEMLNIVFVHYHAKAGGVTTVIKQQMQCVRAKGGKVLFLNGDNPLELPHTRVIPELNYDIMFEEAVDPEYLAEHMIGAIKEVFPEGVTCIHCHNSTLGKNSSFDETLTILADRGYKVFHQLHDFAEDGRPELYNSEPYCKDHHFSAINSRDLKNLRESGLQEEGLHLVPNMISILPKKPDPEELDDPLEKKRDYLFVYPVRAIRRKNIGEIVLLSSFWDNTEWGVTLAPNNPADFPNYEAWKSCAKEVKAPVHFEYGVDYDFADIIHSADAIVSTSVQEGFGFSFLEPWTQSKPMWGRRIDYVCRDFEASGIEFPLLYERLEVELSRSQYVSQQETWLDLNTKKIYSYISNSNSATTTQLKQLIKDLPALWEKYFPDPIIDFAFLSRWIQLEITRQSFKDTGYRKHLMRLNKLDPFSQVLNSPSIETNRKLVETKYGKASYADMLEHIYERVENNEIQQKIDKSKLLLQYIDPRTLFPICIE